MTTKDKYVYSQSWHAQLAIQYGPCPKVITSTDTCSYWAAVLIGFLSVCAISIGSGLWLGFLTSGFLSYYVLGYIEKGTVTHIVNIVTTLVFFGACSLVVFFVVCRAVADLYKKVLIWKDMRALSRHNLYKTRKASLITVAIDSFRERYCVPVRLLDVHLSEEIRKALSSDQSITKFGLSVKDVWEILKDPPTYQKIKWHIDYLCEKGHAIVVKDAKDNEQYTEKYISVCAPIRKSS